MDDAPAEVTECLISVDVEAAGPVPAQYALLSIGACLVDDVDQQFYVELRPDRPDEDPAASAIHGLSLARLHADGVEPAEAMARFATWVEDSTPDGQVPVFVGFNAAFDWMFVADYFHRYAVENPFGYAPLDIKAYYMGRAGVSFGETSRRRLAQRFPDVPHLDHHALHDALDQASLFRRLRADPVPSASST